MTRADTPTTDTTVSGRALTPGRIVALALIGLAIAGLAHLRFAPGTDVTVPAGAKAGDLALERCDYGTEDGNYGADCGTLVVAENSADPKSRLIALPVTRIRARSVNPAEPIFRLEGGPGITNMEFARASRFADEHDVVLVGYRGVDGSTKLDCPEVESAISQSNDILAEKSMRAWGNGLRACAARLIGDGVDVTRYGLVQQVDDLEAARKALGYRRIDLVSESAGTRTALTYSWRYPKSIHRSVMIGANPPGNFVWDAKTTNEQIQRYSELCAKDATCSTRTDDLTATMRRVARDIPDHWLILPIKTGNAQVASFYGLMESTSEAAPLTAPMTVDTWLSADHGDASGLWFQSLLADLAFPKAFVWGQFAAAAMPDAQAASEHFAFGRQRDSIIGDASAFTWGGGRLADAWPANAGGDYSRMRTSNTETLVISGELDFATPPQAATKVLLPYLTRGHQVVLPGFGHSTSVWTEQPEAGTRLITTFFDSGRIDRSLYTPQKVDFTPDVSQTALGKGFAGAMFGLALLTVLSLFWMARRVHKRGRFGRKSSAILRSVYAIILGLGGWFIGVLIVITTMPGIPLNHALLAVLSIGVPVGLGTYWSWVHRDWTVRSKRVGLAAAAVGALVGAWLGFQAGVDLLALITAIVGAVVGANLALIILDLSRPRSAEGRATGATSNAYVPDVEPA